MLNKARFAEIAPVREVCLILGSNANRHFAIVIHVFKKIYHTALFRLKELLVIVVIVRHYPAHGNIGQQAVPIPQTVVISRTAGYYKRMRNNAARLSEHFAVILRRVFFIASIYFP